MRSRRSLLRCCLVVLSAAVFSGLLVTSVSAQENRPLNLNFVGAGGGPPSVVVLADGTLIFKITVFENVSGDLTGTLTEKITQIYPISDEDRLLPITTSWKLQTAEGTIEGYYSGEFQHMQEGNHFIVQHGEVLSATEAYASLYRARVSFQAMLLSDHMTISGKLTIQPREKR